MSCSDNCWGHLLSESGIIHLNRHRMTLGRGSANDFVVRDITDARMVSTQHAVVVQVGKSAILIDTSLNGTYVNSRRVKRTLLRHNDTIRLGKRRLVHGRLNSNTYIYQTKNSIPPITDSSASVTSDIESVKRSLTCELCKDLLVFPAELVPCAHLFCSGCIGSLTKESSCSRCPTCHTELSTFKTRTCYNLIVIFQKILRIVLNKSDFDLYIDRLNRRKAELIQQQKALAALRDKHGSIEYSPRTGDPFLLICQLWSEYERLKFHKGIEKYPLGEAREFYCWMVRLTEQWVKFDATETDLSIAISNLGLLKHQSGERTLVETRDALLRFIYGKCQLQS